MQIKLDTEERETASACMALHKVKKLFPEHSQWTSSQALFPRLMSKWITGKRNDGTVIGLGQPELLQGWEWGQLHPWACCHVWSLSWVCFALDQHFSRKKHGMMWMFGYLASNSNHWADIFSAQKYICFREFWFLRWIKKEELIHFNFLFFFLVTVAKFYDRVESLFQWYKTYYSLGKHVR